MNEMQNNSTAYQEGVKKKQRKKIAPIVRNFIISAALLAVTGILLFVWFLMRPDNKTHQYDYFDIDVIGELTTLECRYHNVSVHDQEGGFMGVGRKYVWFEYDVIVDVGVDIKEVKMEKPTDDGVVRIYLPPAKILGAKEDKSTILKPVCDLGAFTKLTADEERQIINEGVQRLKDDAKTQDVIFHAYSSAKDVLEQYVKNIGMLFGENYTVEWIKVPDGADEKEEQVQRSTPNNV